MSPATNQGKLRSTMMIRHLEKIEVLRDVVVIV